ncbi:MAG: FAD-dependent oxidoreductase [Firmicutes bacterium]|nr:FAD-dependent oxidoreductase [Bacillota bacterium]
MGVCELKTVTITIDGHVLAVNSEDSILKAALKADLYIPHLCHHPDLPDISSCGLCVVEIEGDERIKSACSTAVEANMIIYTKTEKLNKMRRLSMELMLANHVEDCTTCPKYLKCELQSLIQYLGVSTARLKRTLNAVPVNTSNPLFVRDLNRCVSCGRCVRACRDLRGVDVLDYEVMEDDRIMVDVRQHHQMTEENCRFCGACVEVCPTGALQDKEGVFAADLNREIGLLPCRSACPGQINVPKYIRLIKEGNYQEAIAVIRERAPFPHSLGYVCMAFCEDECRRKEINEALSVRELKKFAAAQDQGLWKDKVVIKPASGKKVAIIGSGPAGLTAAYYLKISGHEVTVFEKLPVAGGMLTTGIPAYRLPRKAVQAEIQVITDSGVKILTDTEITDLEALSELGYDEILIATGAGQGTRLPIDGADCGNVLENIAFLRNTAMAIHPTMTGNVVVLGGGNVAFDCARTARRLGATGVTIVCLESREGMTASPDEIEEGLAEGIQIINDTSFYAIENNDNHATGVNCHKVESFKFDKNRKMQLKLVPDSEHIISADTIIFATGQRPEIPAGWNLPVISGNLIESDEEFKVKDSSVFLAGDVSYGTHSVIRAIASGRKAAVAIDLALGGDGKIEDVLAAEEASETWLGRDETFLDKKREQPAQENPEMRITGFAAVTDCFSVDRACKEAERCFQCDLRAAIAKPKFWASYGIK